MKPAFPSVVGGTTPPPSSSPAAASPPSCANATSVKLEGGGASGSKFTRQLGESFSHHPDPAQPNGGGGSSEKGGEGTAGIQRLSDAITSLKGGGGAEGDGSSLGADVIAHLDRAGKSALAGIGLPFDPSNPAAGLSKTALALARMLEVQIQGQVKQAGAVGTAGPTKQAGPAGQAVQAVQAVHRSSTFPTTSSPQEVHRSSTFPTTSSPHQHKHDHQHKHQHDHQHQHQHYPQYAQPPQGYLHFMVGSGSAATGLPHYMPPGYYSGPHPQGHPGAHGGYAGGARQGGIAWPAGVPSSAELHRRQLQWHHHHQQQHQQQHHQHAQLAQQHHLMYASMHGASKYPERAGVGLSPAVPHVGLGLKTIPQTARVLARQSPSDIDAAAAASSLMGQLAGPPPQQQDAQQAPPSPQQQEQQGQKRGRDMPEKEQEKTQDGGGGQPENLIEGGSLDLQQCLKEHRAMWFNVSAGGSDATIALLNMLKCEECRASLQGSTNSTACAQCGWALCKDCQEGTGASKRAKLVGGQEE